MAVLILAAISLVAWASRSGPGTQPAVHLTDPTRTAAPELPGRSGWTAPWHDQVETTVFSPVENASSANGGISNEQSAWNSRFRKDIHANNPYGFALPYNDLDSSGQRKANVGRLFWYDPAANLPDNRSWVEGRWIAVSYGGKVAYAQWVDAGPFGEDDIDYVADPTGKQPWAHQPHQAGADDLGAGLDIEPAVAQFLGVPVDGDARVSWRFVPARLVPNGPWLHSGHLITDEVK
jgi:hypothetical protein